MGSSRKHQVNRSQESNGKKWASGGGVTLRSISTKPKDQEYYSEEEGDNNGMISTTPTWKGAKIPQRLHCPPAPTKTPAKPLCEFNGIREFFTPPDHLESVFVLRADRNN